MNYLFTSESVSEGHPDKVSDQISDALLDEFLAYDPESHVAIETLCTTGQVVVAGEVTSEAYIDVPAVTRNVINRIGYNRGHTVSTATLLACLQPYTSKAATSTVVSVVRKRRRRVRPPGSRRPGDDVRLCRR